jgi:hypothetical protein
MNRDIAAFRAALWKRVEKNSEELTGRQVIDALFEISEDLFGAGVDEAWEEASIENLQDNADIFDLTWITAFSARLKKKAVEQKA